MTTETTLEEDARRWARSTLRESVSSSPEEIPSLLRFIDRSEGVLSEVEADAVQIIARTEPAKSCRNHEQAAQWGRHDRCREMIAELSDKFFELSQAERRRRWKTLVCKCSHSPDLLAQLIRLKPALKVDMPPLPHDPQRWYLLQICRDVFLASPPVAAALRLGFCEKWRADVSTWEEVVDESLDRHGSFLRTVAPWVDEFGDQRFWEARDGDAKSTRHFAIHPPVPVDMNNGRGNERRSEPEAVPENQTSAEIWAGTIWIAMTVLIMIGGSILIVLELTQPLPWSRQSFQQIPLRIIR